MTRPAAVVLEVDRPLEVRVEHAAGVVSLDAAVVHPAREAQQIAREAVAADVGRLPHVLLFGLLGERIEQRAPSSRAARVVLAVRADEEERTVERLSRPREVEIAELLVGREGRAAQDLLSLLGRRGVPPKLWAPTRVRAANEEQARARTDRKS